MYGQREGLAVKESSATEPSSETSKILVETEKLLEKLPAQVNVQVPHVLDVIRETGLVGLRGGDELSLTVESSEDLQRVDVAEFNLEVPSIQSLYPPRRFDRDRKYRPGKPENAMPLSSVIPAQSRIGPRRSKANKCSGGL